MFNKKKKYIAVFLVKEQGTYSVLKLRRFKPNNKVLQFTKGNSHSLDISFPTYLKGLKLYYFIDIKKGQLRFKDSKDKVNPELLDMVLKQSIVRQLTATLTSNLTGQILNIIIGLCIGLPIGIIAGGYL